MKQHLLFTITCLLVLLFCYTGVNKLMNPKVFYEDLHNQPFPDNWAPVLKWMVPVFELFIATLLLFQDSRKTGFALSVFMMLLFTCYTLLVLTGFYERIPCSCGGVIRNLSWPQHLVFNVFFTVISCLGYRWSSKTISSRV